MATTLSVAFAALALSTNLDSLDALLKEHGVGEVGSDNAEMFNSGTGSDSAVEHAVKSDIPFIACATCKQLARRALGRAKSYRADRKAKRLGDPSELDLSLLTSLMCDVAGKIPTPRGDLPHSEGAWIHELDIVESADGASLALKRQSTAGVCTTECHTVAATCQAIMDEAQDDLAESLYMERYADRAALSAVMCNEWTASCVGPPPLVPASRTPGGENFVRAATAKPPPPTTTTTTKKKKKKKRKRKKRQKKTAAAKEL